MPRVSGCGGVGGQWCEVIGVWLLCHYTCMASKMASDCNSKWCCTMTLAFHICTGSHRMFLYAFGVDDVTRSDFPCSHATTFTVENKKIKLSQWWRGKPKKSEELWPNEPSRLVTIERVHKHLPDSPFCVYIMLHGETVKASALLEEDVARFNFTYRVNHELFSLIVRKYV